MGIITKPARRTRCHPRRQSCFPQRRTQVPPVQVTPEAARADPAPTRNVGLYKSCCCPSTWLLSQVKLHQETVGWEGLEFGSWGCAVRGSSRNGGASMDSLNHVFWVFSAIGATKRLQVSRTAPLILNAPSGRGQQKGHLCEDLWITRANARCVDDFSSWRFLSRNREHMLGQGFKASSGAMLLLEPKPPVCLTQNCFSWPYRCLISQAGEFWRWD